MERKSTNPTPLPENTNRQPILKAYYELCALKQLYRQGWLRRGIPKEQCESVAEHSFGMAVLALWLAEAYFPALDQCKVLRMALLHDFGEVYAGDIIPEESISSADKHQREYQSILQIFNSFPGGDTYIHLWKEFEQGTSPEARFVRQLDRLEMGLQASVYTRQGYSSLEEFFATARDALSENLLLGLLNEAQALAEN